MKNDNPGNIMKDSYLIQRLQKTVHSSNELLNTLGEALAFGGGKKNGGLSKEAMNLLRPIFSFDYIRNRKIKIE